MTQAVPTAAEVAAATAAAAAAGSDKPIAIINEHVVVDLGTEKGQQFMQDFVHNQKLYQEMLLNKWSKVPAGKGKKFDWLGIDAENEGYPKLKDMKAKAKMAVILENQLRFQRSLETEVVNGKILMQDTATGDLALPTKFALPIVRRVYALIIERDFGVTQPLPGPTGFVFWLDFQREQNTQNILSVNYNAFALGELAVPQKGKLVLNRVTIQVVKQLMGVTWTLEALEDARAQLGLDIESELLAEFANEFTRDIFGRHLAEINKQAKTGTAIGDNLIAPWLGPNTAHNLATGGGTDINMKKANVYNGLIDADTDFVKANRYPSDGILCGYGLAGYLQKLETATQSQSPTDQNMGSLGITDYGTFAGRWRIWGTDFMPDDEGVMYKRNPTQLQAAHVYAPYVPIQVMPAMYADYDTSTGAYSNKDAFTRNLRERSAHIVTKPYGFQPIKAAGLVF